MATFSLQGTAVDVSVFIRTTDGTDLWEAEFAAAYGQQLVPGRYFDAERAPFRTGRAPGLDVSGAHRGCNELFGRFDINQIATDAQGNVTMLDASFVQHCETRDAPPLHGVVKYRALPVQYSYSSDAGDYIGQGGSQRYLGATSLFELDGSAAGIGYAVSGLGDRWSVQLGPADGGTLAPGIYRDARRFADTTHPYLDVSGNGAGCNETSGTFEIQRIRYDRNGDVTALRATFEQHCELQAPAYRGAIRFHA